MKYSQIDIIGGGCAAFSLARLIKKTSLNNINLFLGKNFDLNKDHFGVFGKMNLMKMLIKMQIISGINGLYVQKTLI